MEASKTVVIGAGLTGISAALHLDNQCVVLEREGAAGGLCVSRTEGGYTFDRTGHWLHLRDAQMKALCLGLQAMDSIQRISSIWSSDRFTEYPFQANLKGLPDGVICECLQGLVEALLNPPPAGARDFGSHVLAHFGAGIAKHFMFPYNTKLWGVPPADISFDWCQRFVPVPDWRTVIQGAFQTNQALGYNAGFSYPPTGGIGTFSAALAAGVKQLRCNCAVVEIDTGKRRLRGSDGTELGYQKLISTMPLPKLVQACVDAPGEVREAAAALRCTSLRYLDLGIRGPALAGNHWVYVPEDKWSVYRLGCYSNASPSMAASGHSSLYVEIRNDRAVTEAQVMDDTLALLSAMGPKLGRENVEVARFSSIPYAYVIYDHACATARSTILDWLGSRDIRSTGRYGGWVYASMEDALLDGRSAAQWAKETK